MLTADVPFRKQVHLKFVRMGAKFDAKTKAEYADIQGKLGVMVKYFVRSLLIDLNHCSFDTTD